MSMPAESPIPSFSNPIEGIALGDPFVLPHRGRFYLYGTADGPGPGDGRVIPVYRSDDLLNWTPLGGALVPAEGEPADYWAPEVMAWNGKFYMVVSFGDVERRGHALWVAVADDPAGPFHLRTQISDPSEKFSIDGSWLLDDDGRLYLFRCLDFVEDGQPPHGTGIVAQPMRDPLTPEGPPVPILRAHSPWQLFQSDRTMPLYDNRRFESWNTIEGPAPVRRHGRYFCGYSGGNYTGAYGTGEAVADAPLGPYTDLRGREGPIFGTVPGLVEGPGHFSVVRPDLVHDWIVLHGRRPGEHVRRVWLCPAFWDAGGVTIGRLTDQPQTAPPLPSDRSRFAPGVKPEGWTFESGEWSTVDDGLASHAGLASGLAWRDALDLVDDFAVEIWVRFSSAGSGRAGMILRSEAGNLSILLPASPDSPALIGGTEGAVTDAPLPTLGGASFDPTCFHRIDVRAGGGTAEVRLDGVILAAGVTVPRGRIKLGLMAEGPAIFDAISATRVVA
ncbi:glycoside hydrolase family 43 protein [Isosphaeraceae bacterium EP7]